MSNLPATSATLHRARDADMETGLQLTLRVTDPEVLSELNQREGAARDAFALTALRVGVLALRQAGGVVDAQRLKNEGDRLISEIEKRLTRHANELDKTVQVELAKYFADDGKLHERVKALTSDDGELARLLKVHVGGDSSTLARQLADSVGKGSPLMKYLSPTERDGLIASITQVAQDKLEQQSKKVLGEFDMNDESSALSRLVKQIETAFDPQDPKTALGVLTKALSETREQIRKELSLDDNDSALNKLQQNLDKQIDELTSDQRAFQEAMREHLGVKQVKSRTTEGGFDFEHAAAEALKPRILALGDEFQSVGELAGVLKRRTGDHLQTLGAESAVPGGRIVFECKRDRSYRIGKARQELEEARKNRQAEVGVFVMSAQTLRDNEALRSEYPAALARYGNDVIAVWDAENSVSDVVLDAAISLARALVVRAAVPDEGDDAKDIRQLADSIADIEKQFERFDTMSRWCDAIMQSAKDAGLRADDIKDELRKVLKRLTSDVKSLSDAVRTLRGNSGGGATI